MKAFLVIFGLIVVASFPASGQQTAHRPDPLLDHMTGHWILQGPMAGHETTHDVDAEWVLGNEYLRLHETSHERNAQGGPAYEAIVFIEWNESTNEYSCLWLDSTEGGALSSQVLGRAKRSGDEIPFLFQSKDGNFHNTFVYSKSTDTWQWIMDNEENGKLKPFARVKLTRK